MSRIDKDKYYLDIAEVVLTRSTCMNKHWGAVLVKDDTIISTGFNGAPRGVKDCYENGYCRLYEYRKKHNLGRGEGYEQCLSCHAEMNAILFVHDKSLTQGSTLYLTGKEITGLDGLWGYVPNPNPCHLCKKLIINAGIEKVICRTGKDQICDIDPSAWTDNMLIGGY